MTNSNLNDLYKAWSGHEADQIEALAPSGSDRKYYRLSGERGIVIGVENENKEENSRFCYFAKLFKEHGINVPEVLILAKDGKSYLQEDLGAQSLIDIINLEKAEGNFPSTYLTSLYKSALDQLIELHFKVQRFVDYSQCFPKSEFDLEMIGWDLNYFKYCFLKAQKPDLNDILLERDFSKLKQRLEIIPKNNFMYRDFQSRNIMTKKDEIYLIDFQGGLRGPGIYDLASLIYQARAGLPVKMKTELINYYFENCKEYLSVSRERFDEWMDSILILRITQTLGAYGFRGLYQKKESFIQSIPAAVSNLFRLLSSNQLSKEFSYLYEIISEVNDKYNNSVGMSVDKLIIRISSFSYKKGGIPSDYSGNGGGFVFDCRGILNPGRFDEYKELTGLDNTVIDFLKKKTKAESFINNSFGLVALTIENYIDRKFEHLMISFGCTGGQHRSVYCAERLYQELTKDNRISIQLEHVEQGIKRT